MPNYTKYLGGLRRIDEPSQTPEIFFLGDEPGLEADLNYDLLVVSSLDVALSPDAIAQIELFWTAGGNVLWIYDEQFQDISASFVDCSNFQAIDKVQGFTVAQSHDITSGLSDYVGNVVFVHETDLELHQNDAYAQKFIVHNDVLYIMVRNSSAQVHTLHSKNGGGWSDLGQCRDGNYRENWAIRGFGSKICADLVSTVAVEAVRVYSTSDGSIWTNEYTFSWNGEKHKFIFDLYAFEDCLYASIEDNSEVMSYIYKSDESDLTSWEKVGEYEDDGVKRLTPGYFIEFDGTLYCAMGDRYYTNAGAARIVEVGGGSKIFSGEYMITAWCVYRGKLFVGTTHGAQIWSFDGTTWTQEENFTGINYTGICSLTVWNNKLYAAIGSRNISPSAIKLYSSTNGSDWSFDSDVPDNYYYIHETHNFSPQYEGIIRISGYHDANVFETVHSPAPVYGDYFRCPDTWDNKGVQVFDPEPGHAMLWTWRDDVSWIAFVTAYDGEGDRGKFVFIGDSNLFTNNAPSHNKGRNKLLTTNIMDWLKQNTNQCLWLAGDWSASGTRKDWMDIESTEDYGVKTFIDNLSGWAFTQKKTDINAFIVGGGLGEFIGINVWSHPCTFMLGDDE